MRHFSLKLMALLMIVFMVAGCAASNNNASEEKADKAGAKPIRVGVLSIDDSLPIVAAFEDGDYEAAGLNVELYPFKSSSDQSKALESGSLDVVMNDMVVQGLLEKAGTHTKIVSYAFGATPQEGRFVVVAAPNSGIEEPEDLMGEPIAISTNTMMEYLMDQYTAHFELPRENMQYVNMPNLMLRLETVVEGKDVKAAILPDPLASFAIQQGCIPVIDDTTLDANYSQSVILATDAVIDEQPDALQTFLNVTFDKMTDINNDPEKYREFALAQANVPESLQSTYPVPTFTPRAVPNEEEINRVMAWLAEKDLVEETYESTRMVDEQFIQGA